MPEATSTSSAKTGKSAPAKKGKTKSQGKSKPDPKKASDEQSESDEDRPKTKIMPDGSIRYAAIISDSGPTGEMGYTYMSEGFLESGFFDESEDERMERELAEGDSDEDSDDEAQVFMDLLFERWTQMNEIGRDIANNRTPPKTSPDYDTFKNLLEQYRQNSYDYCQDTMAEITSPEDLEALRERAAEREKKAVDIRKQLVAIAKKNEVGKGGKGK